MTYVKMKPEFRAGLNRMRRVAFEVLGGEEDVTLLGHVRAVCIPNGCKSPPEFCGPLEDNVIVQGKAFCYNTQSHRGTTLGYSTQY